MQMNSNLAAKGLLYAVHMYRQSATSDSYSFCQWTQNFAAKELVHVVRHTISTRDTNCECAALDH